MRINFSGLQYLKPSLLASFSGFGIRVFASREAARSGKRTAPGIAASPFFLAWLELAELLQSSKAGGDSLKPRDILHG